MSDALISEVHKRASDILDGDKSGHGMDHVNRVYEMSMRFCDHYPHIGRRAVALIALLHDVDDYKLVGVAQAEELMNAVDIMNAVGISRDEQETVLSAISTMGYSKSLKGVRPQAIEGAIVSDADMCDAIGSNGIVRGLTYTLSDKGSGTVFNPDIWPETNLSVEKYTGGGDKHDTDGFINHFFEKLLKLRGMMLTEPGKEEAAKRDELMVRFLRQYFEEQNQPQWSQFLEQYLKQR